MKQFDREEGREKMWDNGASKGDQKNQGFMNPTHELEVLYLYRCYCTWSGRTLKSIAQGEQRSFGDEHSAQHCQLFNSQQSTPPPRGGQL